MDDKPELRDAGSEVLSEADNEATLVIAPESVCERSTALDLSVRSNDGGGKAGAPPRGLLSICAASKMYEFPCAVSP